MKKRIIALALLLVMLLPVSLASCNREQEIPETALKVYTLYTICEESTTEEAIREVELALNRLTVHQLKLGIKLVMTTADKYEDLINDKFEEIKAYEEEQKRLKEEAKKNKDKNKNSSDASDESSANSEDIITADKFLDMLKNGEEYVFDAPRLDIFLVRGFDEYIDLVGKGRLAELDEKLSSEAKLIKDKLYPTFLNAAKVPNAKGKTKIYGVPMNTVIGEYEYVVFDEELLNKYEIDAMTMNTLEDLEYYLRIIKENEPDVVPLANAFDSTYCTYLFADGFPAMVDDDGVVINPYEDSAAIDYYTYISRYRTLGYLEENTDKRFAVKFVKGTFEDLEALEKQTGHSYISAVHSYPVATNENTLQNLFCVNSGVVSNQLTDVANILAFIETSEKAANLLAYGVENENYRLDDNNQVVRLNDTYVVNNNYIGNAFLTYTMAGENPNKWEIFKQQNLDSAKGEEQAKSLGFAYYPNTFTDPDNKDIVHEEPNYISIITPIADKLYSKIMSGEAAMMDYSQLMDEIKETVDASLVSQVEEKYVEELTSKYHRQIEAYYNSDAYKDSIRERARDAAIKSFITTPFKNTAKRELQTALRKEFPGISSSELVKLTNERLTDEYLAQRVIEKTSEKEIDNATEKVIFDSVSNAISRDKKALPENAEYVAELAVILSSEECMKEKNEILSADNYYLYQDELAKMIHAKLVSESESLRKELSDAIKKEYTAFINKSIKEFDFNDESKRSKTLYNQALDTLAAEEKNARAIKREFTNAVKAEMPDAKADDIEVEAEKRMTEEAVRAKLLELELVTTAQIRTTYNQILSDYINDAVGFVKKSDSKDDETSGEETSGEESSEEPSEEPGEENPDEPIIIDENSDYFKLFYETRLKKQYYNFAPLKEGVKG